MNTIDSKQQSRIPPTLEGIGYDNITDEEQRFNRLAELNVREQYAHLIRSSKAQRAQ